MTRVGGVSAFLALPLLYASPVIAQDLSHDLLIGPEILFFESGSASDLSVAARASGHLQWTPPLDGTASLLFEPRVGLRVLNFEEGNSTEFIAELREAVVAPRRRGIRWQLVADQKLRTLSDPPELPAFLEPGRFDAYLGGSVVVPVSGRWELEARSNAGVVRYAPDEWEVLDRNVATGFLAVRHPVWTGMARLSVGTGAEDYRDLRAAARDDTRWDLRGEWSTTEPVFIQLEGGLVWNSSDRRGFDYRAARAALLLSLPVGSGSAQLYAAVASKTYTDPGPADALVAPSDRDTGSFVILQAVQPLGRHTNLHLRGELSSSETGFRDEYFQRIGFSALLSLD